MRVSKHAICRAAQRGVRFDSLQLVLDLGTPVAKPGGAVEYRLRRKDGQEAICHLKRAIRQIEKATNAAVLVGEDGDILTTYRPRD